MTGLALANSIQDADEFQKLSAKIADETRELLRAEEARQAPGSAAAEPEVAPAQVRHDFEIPNPPDLRLHVLNNHDLERIFTYISPQMLYVRHLGFKGRFAEALQAADPGAVELLESVRRVEDLVLADPTITAAAVFKFFPCRSDGQNLVIFNPDGTKELERFYFGRQSQRDGLCLADYALPLSPAPGVDYLAMFATTIGPGVRTLADQMAG